MRAELPMLAESDPTQLAALSGFFCAHAMTEICKCKSCTGKHAFVTTDSVTASGFFTTEQIGKKQSFTPEGFLLCEQVPIARIGNQDYAGIELPDLEDKDGVIEVERDEGVVFSPDTIGSFIGKPVTIDHPNDPVTPANWSVLAKGGTHNVQRGEGDLSDFLVADLLITDKGAINDVVSRRLTEISCGYESDYEQIAPGRARQVTIVGNHVALVKSARCGPACSITADSSKHLGENPMAVKKGATSFADKMRKIFMTRDADEFEKAISEMKDEDVAGDPAQHIHIHMPGAEKDDGKEETNDEEIKPADDPDRKLSEVLSKFDARLTSIESAVSELKGKKTDDSEEEKKEETKDGDGDEDDDADQTADADEEGEAEKESKKSTNDSASFKSEFQDARARAEILSPGVKLPTFDAKAAKKKTSDSICVLRRRALRASLDGENADLVKAITGDADVSKMTCDTAKAFFNAASELVKQKNSLAPRASAKTDDSKTGWADINKRHNDFWSNRT
ncbi:MAG: DUF2213 domain-containing protein [Janthinobacterium lividum]